MPKEVHTYRLRCLSAFAWIGIYATNEFVPMTYPFFFFLSAAVASAAAPAMTYLSLFVSFCWLSIWMPLIPRLILLLYILSFFNNKI